MIYSYHIGFLRIQTNITYLATKRNKKYLSNFSYISIKQKKTKYYYSNKITSHGSIFKSIYILTIYFKYYYVF